MLFVLLLNFCFTVHAKHIERKSKVNFLFVEWKENENLLLLGHFINQSKKIVEIKCSPDELTDSQLQKWLKGNNAVFLFHCMWGQQPLFHRIKYLKTFNEVCISSHDKNYTVISFLWHAGGINYKSNWDRSFNKGSNLSGVVKRINQLILALFQ